MGAWDTYVLAAMIMKKCGMQNLTPEMAEGINLSGTQRYNFKNSVGGDPSARVKYDPLATKKPRKRKQLKARKQPKAKPSYAGVRVYFSAGDVVIKRPLSPKDVGAKFPSATKMECLSKSGTVLMVLDVPKVIFGKLLND